MLDKELKRRTPSKRSHRKIVGAAIMDSKLLLKISQGEERVARIEAFLIFSVTALHLAVMSGSIRADQFMLNT